MSRNGRSYAWDHSPYRGSKFIVHLALGDVANDLHNNELFATNERIAKKCRIGRSAVADALATMVADGYLEILAAGGGRGKPTRYRFLTPETVCSDDSFDQAIPRDPRQETARSDAETARSADCSQYFQPKEPKEGPPSVAARARVIAQRVFEQKQPKPAQPFPAIQRIAERMLAAGHTEETLLAAMLEVPTISTGWLEGRLNGRAANGRKPTADDTQRMIDERFGLGAKQ